MGIFKKAVYLGFIILGAINQSCTKNEFMVEFQLSEDLNANYKLQYYASNSKTGFQMENIANVEKGLGEAKCITRMPTLVYLYLPNSNVPSLIFYAEKGDKILIKGENNNPVEWEVDGNKINVQWSEWRHNNLKALQSDDPQNLNKAVADYVVKNPKDKLSLLLLLTYYNRRLNEKEYSKLWNMLTGDAKNEALIRLIGRADQLNDAGEVEGKVSRMKLHCQGDTIITYNPSKYVASIFYFNRNNSSQRREMVDSLKKLTELSDYKDRGLVVNVSFECDSTSWKSGIRKDSLENGMQAWVFAGEADERIMKMNVPRTPYFIVCSKNGKELYRGDNYSDAAKEFKKLIIKKKK